MDNAGFIIAAYLATAVVLLVYALSVHGRLRRARDRGRAGHPSSED